MTLSIVMITISSTYGVHILRTIMFQTTPKRAHNVAETVQEAVSPPKKSRPEKRDDGTSLYAIFADKVIITNNYCFV